MPDELVITEDVLDRVFRAIWNLPMPDPRVVVSEKVYQYAVRAYGLPCAQGHFVVGGGPIDA